MAKAIIALSGPIASGKGTVKEYIVRNYSAKDCRFSTILRDVLGRINQPITRENLVKVSVSLRKTFGESTLAKAIVKDAVSIDNDIVVVDGVRRLADIEYLSKVPNFNLIAVDARLKIRHERLVKRGENEGDSTKTYSRFLKDHEYETEKSIPAVMRKAKYNLDNNGSFEDLYKQIDSIMKKILR